MSERTIGSLGLHRPSIQGKPRRGARVQNVALVKEKLLEELVELEKQLEELKNGDGAVNFSLLQTYKEMIACRKRFFKELTHWQ